MNIKLILVLKIVAENKWYHGAGDNLQVEKEKPTFEELGITLD